MHGSCLFVLRILGMLISFLSPKIDISESKKLKYVIQLPDAVLYYHLARKATLNSNSSGCFNIFFHNYRIVLYPAIVTLSPPPLYIHPYHFFPDMFGLFNPLSRRSLRFLFMSLFFSILSFLLLLPLSSSFSFTFLVDHLLLCNI